MLRETQARPGAHELARGRQLGREIPADESVTALLATSRAGWDGTRQRPRVGSRDATVADRAEALNYTEFAGRADGASKAHDMAVIS